MTAMEVALSQQLAANREREAAAAERVRVAREGGAVASARNVMIKRELAEVNELLRIEQQQMNYQQYT